MGKPRNSMLLVAYRVGQNRLRPYAHRFRPQKFTRPQLFACVALTEFLRLDDRNLSVLPDDTSSLCQATGLDRVPHFTTFHKAGIDVDTEIGTDHLGGL